MSKKRTITGLIVFYILAFLMILGLSLFAARELGNDYWISSPEHYLVGTIGLIGMLAPSFAALIVRFFITKEKWKDHRLTFTPADFKTYGLMVAVLVLGTVFSGILVWITVFKGDTSLFSFKNLIKNVPTMGYMIGTAMLYFWHAFGEEWGWRGYMMPKLNNLMPRWAALILGGVLWGLWHAPLTVCGHNFGVTYPGYPFTGILFMCIFCVNVNVFLTAVTERTGSVFPAAVMHSLINGFPATVMLSAMLYEDQAEKAQEIIMDMHFGSTVIASMSFSAVLLLAGILIFCSSKKVEKP